MHRLTAKQSFEEGDEAYRSSGIRTVEIGEPMRRRVYIVL
jgi:hypothetical protein